MEIKHLFFKVDRSKISDIETDFENRKINARKQLDEFCDKNKLPKTFLYGNDFNGKILSTGVIIRNSDKELLDFYKNNNACTLKNHICADGETAYIIRPNKRIKTGKELKETIDEALKLFEVFGNSDVALWKELGVFAKANCTTGNRFYVQYTELVELDNLLLFKVPYVDLDYIRKHLSTANENVIEIKQSEYFALQGL